MGKNLIDRSQIVLAHEEPFTIGRARVHPARREVLRDDGRRETLEPRVMQVLVALRRARGEVVTRDQLTDSCWEGRVVGEDAITRVISRLRRLAEDLGDDGFRIETVRKVGFRLISAREDAAASAALSATGASPPSRRRLLAGGAGVAAACAAGAALVWSRSHGETAAAGLDAPTQALYDQGWTALGNGLPEQVAQGAGLFRRVVGAAPGFADGWGALAFAYAIEAAMSDLKLRPGLRMSAEAAAERAMQLDPDNPFAPTARAMLQPLYGNWLRAETAYRAALARHPATGPLLLGLSDVLLAVGRLRQAGEVVDRLTRLGDVLPIRLAQRILVLRDTNRLEEADRAAAEGLDTFPRSPLIWFNAVYLFMRSGRPERAIALASNRNARPPGLPESDFDLVLASARALASRAPEDVDLAMAMSLEAARRGPEYFENAIQLAAMLGRVDAAFELVDAFYRTDPNDAKRTSFSSQQGVYGRDRHTAFLFSPSTAPLRADARFQHVVRATGLNDYWAKCGCAPDYRA